VIRLIFHLLDKGKKNREAEGGKGKKEGSNCPIFLAKTEKRSGLLMWGKEGKRRRGSLIAHAVFTSLFAQGKEDRQRGKEEKEGKSSAGPFLPIHSLRTLWLPQDR